MTRRSISWIDPSDLADLADRASSARPRPAPSRSTSPGVVPSVSVPRPSRPPAPELAPFSPVGTSLETRLESFLDWVESVWSPTAVFVSDAHGLGVSVRGGGPEQVAMTATLMNALAELRKQLSNDAGRMGVVLGDGEVLQIVSAETDYGAFGAGLLAAKSVSDDDLGRIQDALIVALATSDGG